MRGTRQQSSRPRLLSAVLSAWLLWDRACGRQNVSSSDLSIPVYIGPSSFVVETAFVTRVVIATVPRVCKKCVVVRAIEDFVKDCPEKAVLVITFAISKEEWTVVKQNTIVVIHLSTTYTPESTQFYADASAVFRQYWTEEIELRLPGNRSTAPHTTWLPQGFGRFENLPALKGPLQARKNLWTWLGSVGMSRPQRPRMVEGLQGAPSHIIESGKLHVFENFAGAEAMLPLEYSSTLYDSVFLPLPAGHSADQYRLWEAFEAGCVPIFLSGQMEQGSVLLPIQALNFSFLEVDDWLHLPKLLEELSVERQQDPSLQRYQQIADHNEAIWKNLKSNISMHFADVLLHNLA